MPTAQARLTRTRGLHAARSSIRSDNDASSLPERRIACRFALFSWHRARTCHALKCHVCDLRVGTQLGGRRVRLAPAIVHQPQMRRSSLTRPARRTAGAASVHTSEATATHATAWAASVDPAMCTKGSQCLLPKISRISASSLFHAFCVYQNLYSTTGVVVSESPQAIFVTAPRNIMGNLITN
jgi:hypothetical protein